MRRASFSDLCVDTKADAATALLDGGYLRVFDGAQPDSVDVPVGGQTCLAVLRFGSPAFAAAYGGRAVAYAFAPCMADTQGTPTWFRAFTAQGAAVFDGSVGSGPRLRQGALPVGGLTAEEEFDMYVDGDLFEGGEVVVERMTYVERKR